MKILFPMLILLIFACKTPKDIQHVGYKEVKSNVIIYKIPLPEYRANIFHAKVVIERNKYSEKYQFIELPRGGTMTDVFIRSPEDSSYHYELHSWQNGLLWNIGSVPNGIYHAHYGSCNFAGNFEITLKSK